MSHVDLPSLRSLLSVTRCSPPGAEWLNESRPLVLFGAGGRGRSLLHGLRAVGAPPVAFSDNQPALWGTFIEGLPVLAPEEAAARHPDAVFVATIWSDRIGHPLAALHAQLASLGIKRVASFTSLYARFPEQFFPDFFLESPGFIQGSEAAIEAAAALWSDAASAREFISQLKLRLTLDFSVIAGPCTYQAYFPPDLFALTPMEVFVDCGAYDGDTYRDFLNASGGVFARYIALEPDSLNFAKLSSAAGAEALGDAPRVVLYPVGASEEACVMRFASEGSPQSRASGEGTQKITCVALDDLLRDEAPTYIKMDIEGAEAAALRGAAMTLARHRPILAVSTYHSATDLWKLPLLIAGLVKDYAFFLRPEKHAGWDLVCYAVPLERLLSTAKILK